MPQAVNPPCGPAFPQRLTCCWPKRSGTAIERAMLDRLYMPLLGLAALAAIALSLVWPQGRGARAPDPCGPTPEQQKPAVQAAMRQETEASQRRMNDARDAVRTLQSQAIAPSE